MKAFVIILLQLPLLVLSNDVAVNETSNRDNKTQLELTTVANQVNSSVVSSSLPPVLDGSSTISVIESKTTEGQNETLSSESTVPPTTTIDPQLELIPPAKVEAQIIKVNITTKKPSRLAAAAAAA